MDGEVEYSPPDSVVRIFRASDGSAVTTIDVGWNPIKALAFTGDGETLVTLHEELRRYRVSNGELIGLPHERDGFVPERLYVSPDGTRVLGASPMANDVFVWDLTTEPTTSRSYTPVEAAQPPSVMSPDFAALAMEIAGEQALLQMAESGQGRRKGGRRR